LVRLIKPVETIVPARRPISASSSAVETEKWGKVRFSGAKAD
jgi:hypothetical protein